MANIYAEQNYLTMSRSKNTLKAPVKTSMPFGKLVPLGLPLDVLPGSTIKCDLANITRMLTPVSPIMDDVSMDCYSFFIPWRVLFNKTKNFFGENDQVAWTLVQNVNLPHIILDTQNIDAVYTDVVANFDGTAQTALYLVDNVVTPTKILKSIFEGSLFDYFGLPFVYPSIDQMLDMDSAYQSQAGLFISFQAMPFRGLQSIFNEFFRNENVTDPILDLLYDENDLTIDLYDIHDMYIHKKDPVSGSLTYNFWFLPSVARWKDLFTSLNPAPQRGAAVALPLSASTAPVVGGSSLHTFGTNGFRLGSNATTPLTAGYNLQTTFMGHVAYDGTYGGTATTTVNASNLEADLSGVTMATVNQIRYAFATQRYYEKLARGGARYHEYLKVMFGVRPSDATLQRPQFLGGHHEHINIQQVLQTSESATTPLGSTGAYSVTGFKTHTFTNSFNEFGIIMNLGAIRKQHSYCQGMDKYWTKRDVWDIYNPTFAHIGEVPVQVSEVYWTPTNAKSGKVLGYNEAWYEYRSARSLTCGLLNPLAPNNLASFVLTDVYETEPTLDDKFIFEDPNGLDRVLVGSATYTNQFICDFLFKYTISAVMPVHSTPGLIDHY